MRSRQERTNLRSTTHQEASKDVAGSFEERDQMIANGEATIQVDRVRAREESNAALYCSNRRIELRIKKTT